MFWAGSFTSQVLQWTQFCALIWNLSRVALGDHLVDLRRAVSLRRLGILRQGLGDRDARDR